MVCKLQKAVSKSFDDSILAVFAKSSQRSGASRTCNSLSALYQVAIIKVALPTADEEWSKYDNIGRVCMKYEIQTRRNGQEALEALVKNDFDVALLDLMLPDINGAEIMDHIES